MFSRAGEPLMQRVKVINRFDYNPMLLNKEEQGIHTSAKSKQPKCNQFQNKAPGHLGLGSTNQHKKAVILNMITWIYSHFDIVKESYRVFLPKESYRVYIAFCTSVVYDYQYK